MPLTNKQFVRIGDISFPFNTCIWNAQAIFANEQKIQIGTQFDFEITGIINDINPTAFANKLVQARRTLSTPILMFTNTDFPFFEISIGTSAGSGTKLFYLHRDDCDDSTPIISNITFDNFIAGISCRYKMNVSIFKKEVLNKIGIDYKKAGGSDWPGVVQISKAISFDYDASGLCTRTITGVIMTTNKYFADSSREKIIKLFPPPETFKRSKQTFSCSADSRRLDFIIVDQELINSFPDPITEGNAVFEVQNEGNAIVNCKLSGWFSTPKSEDNNSNKKRVMQKILDLVNFKFQTGEKTVVWRRMSIGEDLYNSNRIDFNFESQSQLKTNVNKQDTISSVTNLRLFMSLGQTITDKGIYPSTRSSSNLVDSNLLYWYDATVGNYKNLELAIPSEKTNSTLKDRDNKQRPEFISSTFTGQKNNGNNSNNKGIDNPYLSFIEKCSYECQTNIKSFYPMSTTMQKPICQQTKQARVYLIQTGSATRLNTSPEIPKPLYAFNSNPKAYIINSFISPDNRIWDANGNAIHTISWRYIIELDSSVFDFTDSIKLSIDPRINGDNGYTIPKESIDNGLSLNNIIDFPKNYNE
jgi:hypothetical protein